MKRYKKAIAAYQEIMMAPLEPGETGFSPPPTNIRDKKWAEVLRGMWPEFVSVKLKNNKEEIAATAWCHENAQFWYKAQNGSVFYFSDIVSATAFKLSFGGTI